MCVRVAFQTPISKSWRRSHVKISKKFTPNFEKLSENAFTIGTNDAESSNRLIAFPLTAYSRSKIHRLACKISFCRLCVSTLAFFTLCFMSTSIPSLSTSARTMRQREQRCVPSVFMVTSSAFSRYSHEWKTYRIKNHRVKSSMQGSTIPCSYASRNLGLIVIKSFRMAWKRSRLKWVSTAAVRAFP